MARHRAQHRHNAPRRSRSWLKKVAGGTAALTIVGGAVVATVVSLAPAGAATLAPPFNQCPSVGLSPSCKILIDVEANGASILDDPNVGPYDGLEDTLVGIVNNGTSPLASYDISTPGINSFGFDYDGICYYGVTDATGGCYGPTTYEGPGTSFSNISPDATSGTVNFNPPLNPGESRFFSLEQALSGGDFKPPIMTGRAYGLSATKTGLGGSTLVNPLPDTGVVSTSQSTVVSRPCVPYSSGMIQAHLLCGKVVTDAPTTTSTATTSADDVTIGINKLPAVVLKNVTTTSSTNCTASAGATTIGYLSVGTTVVIGKPTSVAPNTKVSIGGINLVLNQQTAAPAGAHGLTVKGVHLTASTGLGQGIDAIVGYADSGLQNCP